MRLPAKQSTGKAGGQNVKRSGSSRPINLGLSPGPKLVRTTFRTSREMDFFSKKELGIQTGHEVADWPLVIVKELVDNALDACEETDTPPVVGITADATGIAVRDNGPGLPEATLKGAMDFTVRVSNREAYVSPDRGAQGNALKTLIPMPRVVDPAHGRLIVTAHDKRHVITCGADPISQRAVINDDANDQPTIGTEVRLEWSARQDEDGEVTWPFNDLCPYHFGDRLKMLVEGFVLFNPHATVRLDWFGQVTTWEATEPTWQKWKPSYPTSAHWYEQHHLERLIGAYITHDKDHGQDRLVSGLVSEFDGLSGSQKRSRVLEETGLHRVSLSAFVTGGRLDGDRINRLLQAMQKHTRPVTPVRLGLIGEEHLRRRLLGIGVRPDSFRYLKKVGKEAVPWVLESAFGWLGDNAADDRRIYSGANWSAAIKNPFRSFGQTGEGLEAVLTGMRVGRAEPVVFVLHLAHPRVEYPDPGKSALVIGGGA